jgi:drug/metabolite transporter (DMT)-like permease
MSQNGSSRPDPVALGVVAILLTVFAMSVGDAIVKYVSTSFPLWQIYVVRSLVVIPVLTALSIFGGVARIEPKSKGWVFLRGMLLALMYVAIYAAVPVLSLSVLAAALYTGPLFMALFSALLIGEPVGRRRWAAIFIGFAGVLVILRPAQDDFSFLTLIPIVAGVLYALAAVITRSKCSNESPMALAFALNFSLLIVGIIATLGLALWHSYSPQVQVYPFLLGNWVVMGPREWSIIALLGALMVAISTGLAKAYQSAPPAVIATFDYAYLVFAAFWSYAIFSEPPDAATIVGMFMIAGAGLLVVRQGTVRGATSSSASLRDRTAAR